MVHDSRTIKPQEYQREAEHLLTRPNLTQFTPCFLGLAGSTAACLAWSISICCFSFIEFVILIIVYFRPKTKREIAADQARRQEQELHRGLRDIEHAVGVMNGAVVLQGIHPKPAV